MSLVRSRRMTFLVSDLPTSFAGALRGSQRGSAAHVDKRDKRPACGSGFFLAELEPDQLVFECLCRFCELLRGGVGPGASTNRASRLRRRKSAISRMSRRLALLVAEHEFGDNAVISLAGKMRFEWPPRSPVAETWGPCPWHLFVCACSPFSKVA